MNNRAKFDAANIILAGEIRNRIQTQKKNKKKQETIYPHVAYRHVWIIKSKIKSSEVSLPAGK